jgi:tetratricopeptide (TPR) repeat protein
MRRIFYLSCYFLLSYTIAFSQQEKDDAEKIFDDAEYFFSSGDYQESLYLFLKLTRLQPDNANFNYRTGITYLNIPGEEIKAIPFLEKAVSNTTLKYRSKDLDEKRAPHYAWFYLGNAYRINNDLDKALDSYTRFKSIKDFEKKYNIGIVEAEVKVCERAKIIKDSPLNLVKTNVGAPINSSSSDYSAVLTADENMMVFMNSQKFYEAIMMSKKIDGLWIKPVNITPQIGSDGNMRPTCLSADGKDLYLVKNDKNNADIYISHLEGNLWTTAVPLNKNINSRSNETFASLSPDGKSLYFTSDRSGSIGGLDIFVSRRPSVGDWGEAQNLGPVINTEQDEEAPYMSDDGKTLFFSSKGHFNMGGFDIFYAHINKYNQFDEAINLGYPINTTNDNKGFFPVKDGKSGYMTLFEDNNLGKDDIYKLDILPFTNPLNSGYPKFDKSFTISVSSIDSIGKIEITYDNQTDQFNVKSTDGKIYKVSVTDDNK